MGRLRDMRRRDRLVRELESHPRRTLHDAVFTYMKVNKDLEGMSLPDIAEQRWTSLGETLIDLLIEEDGQICYRGAPPDSVRVWDQVSRDAMEPPLKTGPTWSAADAIPIGSMPHPRAYGCFPRFLGRLRKKHPIISLEQTVQRMTDNPARRFGLTDRGRIQTGAYADIVIFDADHVMDNATYDDPIQFPTGIPFVLVNGQVAVDNERCTGALSGQAVP